MATGTICNALVTSYRGFPLANGDINSCVYHWDQHQHWDFVRCKRGNSGPHAVTSKPAIEMIEIEKDDEYLHEHADADNK